MTENEMLAVFHFNYEMHKSKKNMLKILRNESNMTDDEFIKYMNKELIRYNDCKEMRDYYISDCNIRGDLCNG